MCFFLKLKLLREVAFFMSDKVDEKSFANSENRETELAYGGQALIEGIMMKGKSGYAFTVKKPDGTYYKEMKEHKSLASRNKFLGLPFVRGVAGFVENMSFGMGILNRSASIAFPEEIKENSKTSNITMFITFALALVFAFGIFNFLPYFLTSITKIDHNQHPFSYNLIAGCIRMVFFFLYIVLISFMSDTKRLFGYHGAEHKTIHAYEQGLPLTMENVRKSSRLHPRCGTSFMFIVFLITIFVFPFINELFIRQSWYLALPVSLQKIVIILSHIVIGLPIVSGISYEILKLAGKFYKSPIVKVLVSPGLFFQLFTTREPDDDMIKAGILSLSMLLGREELATPRDENSAL